MTDHARPPVWVLAGLLVGLAHAAGAVGVMMRTPTAESPQALPILLDLAPVDPAPQMAEAASAPPEPQPESEPEPQPEPEPEPEPAPEKKPDRDPELPVEPPPDTVIESVVPPPPPAPTPPRPLRPKPRPPSRPAPAQTAPVTEPAPIANATPNAAAGPPVSAPAPALPAAPSADAMAQWASRLAAHLERYKHYPEEARRSRRQGIAQVRFTLASDGRVLTVALHRSTGSEILDREAVEWLHRASPLPVPPDGTPPNIALVVPLAFQLR